MNNKTKKVTVRFNEAEHEKIYTAALQADMSISAYMRYCLLHGNNNTSIPVAEDTSSDCTNVNHNDEVKRIMIQLTALIENQSDNNKDKAEMKGLVEKAWQSLR